MAGLDLHQGAHGTEVREVVRAEVEQGNPVAKTPARRSKEISSTTLLDDAFLPESDGEVGDGRASEDGANDSWHPLRSDPLCEHQRGVW